MNKTYTIINNTSNLVEIVTYRLPDETEMYDQRLVFPPNFLISKSFKGSNQNGEYFSYESYFTGSLFAVKKIDIIFNNSRKTTYYTCFTGDCSQPRNIFNPFYDIKEVEIYSITNDDFMNATPCNGPCN